MKRISKPLIESDVLRFIAPLAQKPGLFLETTKCDNENKTSYLFLNPLKIIEFNVGDDPRVFFNTIENYLKKDYWIAGYFSYEFGYILESVLNGLIDERYTFPLAWIGVFKQPRVINHQAYNPARAGQNKSGNSSVLKNSRCTIAENEYIKGISKIKKYLTEGETYQVNYTHKYLFDRSGDIRDLYLNIRKNQSTPYSGFINDAKRFILSFSPELFFRIKKGRIITRPMKGTCPRGKTVEEDLKSREFLKTDFKNKAENIMIVDLLRNDIGKIARKGSVKVTKSFEVETYPSLFQMTSTIKAQLRKNISLHEIFKALFPSGSVTGAPKINTMRIIKFLEKDPRDVYTGAIGYISPKKDMSFNVAIRTLIIEKGKKVNFGVGSGIVADSEAHSEYEECALKTRFLHRQNKDFSLIETILCENGKYVLFDLHMRRLEKSANYFGIPLNKKIIIKKLVKTVRMFDKKKKYFVRMLIDMQGGCSITFKKLDAIPDTIKIKVVKNKINSNEILLYHKTTVRGMYERERKKAIKEGFFDVIFTNQLNQITEGCISNVFIKKNGMLITPPVSSGLLPGVLRQHLLNKKKATEKNLYMKDFIQTKEIYIGNSIRGLIRAMLVS